MSGQEGVNDVSINRYSIDIMNEIINRIMESTKFVMGDLNSDLLCIFARMVNEENKKYNLTGYNDFETILSELILDCIIPVIDFKVPRGTRCLDLGTGSGIPGIPLAVYFDDMTCIMIDSSVKKTGFVSKALKLLSLDRCSVICARAEELAHDNEYRESFNLVFARAFSPVPLTVEIGSAFLMPGGYQYIYSSEWGEKSFNNDLFIKYIGAFGMELIDGDEARDMGVNRGIILRKNRNSSNIYPRRFAAMKRDSTRIMKEMKYF